MSRFRDALAPLLAGAVVVAVAVAVTVLLNGASDRGTSALIAAKQAQVNATADSFNARVNAQLSSAAGLSTSTWELTLNSANDQKRLQTFAVDPNAQSGFFLVDAQGLITDGILLRPGRLGTHYLPSSWARIKTELAAKPVVVEPVESSGYTTDLPEFPYIVAIHDRSGTGVSGAIVAEQAITSTSAFQEEIAQLGTNGPASSAWFFLDSRGTVVASSLPTGLGRPVENDRYRTMPAGRRDIGARLVFAADVPALGWRVVFREDRSQFVKAVAAPLQQAGLILVLLLLGVGLLVVVLLIRRLRAAREEERRLRELNRSQSEFVSVVSHELRTPVAGVLGFLQTTLDHWEALSDTDRRHTVRRAMVSARRLQAMTRDVLDTENIDAGRLAYLFDRIDLVGELRTAAEASTAVDSSRRVEVQAPSAPVWIDADPDRLQQVFGNLLDNARRDAPAGEPITITVEVIDDVRPKVRVSVVDHGPGIPAEARERIFDKFVRGRESGPTGTGLGLYISRRITEAHHGRIWCESSPAGGTAFIVELPVAAPLGEPTSRPDAMAAR